MPLKTLPFDVAKHLVSFEAQRELLADAASSGDAAYISHALNTVARARGLAEIACEAGISREALFDALLAENASGTATLMNVFRVLGVALPSTAVSTAAQ